MKFKITCRYGDEDLWEKFQLDNGNEWMVIRDHKVGLYYFGHILTYSDTERMRELIMKEVSVFTKDGELCYEVDKVYIGRQFDDITIEKYSKEIMLMEEENE
jgi:hypothetical protein